MDDRRRSRVQEVEAFDDLPAPGLQDSLVDLLEPPQVGLQGAGRHQLRHEDDALLRPGEKDTIKGDPPIVLSPAGHGVEPCRPWC